MLPLPVVLTDRTGLVVGLDAAPVLPPQFVDEGVTPAPGAPNAMVLFWLGGACDASVEIQVTELAGNVLFGGRTTRRDVACDAIGIPRFVQVTLSDVVDERRIEVAFEP